MISQAQVADGVNMLRQLQFPAGALITMEDLQDAGREHILDRLREQEPVTWLPVLGGWLITSRDGAREMLLPKAGATVEVSENMVRASLGKMMLTVDAPAHDRLRAPFERPFRARESEHAFGDFIRGQADALIDRFAEAGKAELHSAFAAEFAVAVAGHVIGLPHGESAKIDAYYADFAAAMVYDGDPEPVKRADLAREQLDKLLLAGLNAHRSSGAASLTNEVLASSDNELSDEEVVAQLRVVMFGAVETIQASVMSTLLLLLTHPDALSQCLADRSLIPGAVDEAIRLIPPVAFIERWMGRPFTACGVTIDAGEFVGISVIAVNRDPAVFADPLTFDIHRANAKHGLGFSAGEHHCLGVHLARTQTAIAVDKILSRLPNLTLVAAVPPAGFAFRRPGSLELSWRV